MSLPNFGQQISTRAAPPSALPDPPSAWHTFMGTTPYDDPADIPQGHWIERPPKRSAWRIIKAMVQTVIDESKRSWR